jgi:GNAT superfamily N-acetyltransferase
LKVDEKFRGLGYSHDLVSALVDEANAQGVTEIGLESVNPYSAYIFSQYGRVWLMGQGVEVPGEYFLNTFESGSAFVTIELAHDHSDHEAKNHRHFTKGGSHE